MVSDHRSDDPATGERARLGRAPGGWPVLGHFGALRRRPLEFVGGLASHGDLVEVRIGPIRGYFVCDAGLTHQVLTDFRTFDRAGLIYDRVRSIMGNGLATSGYRDHRRQRPIMQPAFRREHLPGYAAAIRGQVAATMDGWRDGDSIDVVDEMFGLTTSVTLRALFSSRLDAIDAARLHQAFDVFLRGTFARLALPGLGKLPLPGNRRYRRALADWRTQVSRLIASHRDTAEKSDDLLSRLSDARDDAGNALSAEELADQVAVLLIAGAETTSAVIAWTIYLLGKHPDVLAAVRAEADTVLGGAVADWPDLPRLDLTSRVVREALRLYPPAWMLPRTTTTDTVLGGHELRAGSLLLISPYLVHRDERLFPHADQFRPERWISAPAQSAQETPDPSERRRPVHRHSYVPFGGGATRCIGEEIGNTEAVLTLASIAARWDFSLADAASDVAPNARLVLVPRNLRIQLTRR